MELIVLGSGTSVPHPKRSSSGLWVETAGGAILLDCSAQVPHRVAQENLDWANLDAIWISHFHLDHCGGLAPLLFGTKYAPQTQNREKPLRIFGPKGLEKLLENLSDSNDYGLLQQPFPLEIVEVETLEKFEIVADVEAVAAKTPHTDESHAIHIRDSQETVVYTADTGFDVALAALARRVDLFLLECSFVKNKPVDIHLELAEAVNLVRRAEPKKTILTHFYAEWDEVNFEEEIKKFSPGFEITGAFDGMRLKV
ncbi:MAG: ribonuclease Z [Acidobacteria bacterium]|nr:ribonuclease Z [Acidobacteriota bacterium]